MKTLYLIVIASLLFACKSASTDDVPQNFSAAPEKGIAIASITFEGDSPKNDIYRFFYSATSGDKKFLKRNAGKFMVKAREDNNRGWAGDFNNKKTYLVVIEREPGNYAFNQYNYLTHIGYSGMVDFSKPFAIPFEIKKSEITYIGELLYNDQAMPGTPRITVSDKYERDIPEFKKKYPSVQWETSQNKTAKTGDTGNGIIEFTP